MSQLTRLLEAATGGDRRAAAEVLPLVYEELRRLAAGRLADEAAGHTLQPTALVHEAYLRLVGPRDDRRWDGRGHFFAAAAEAMRRILIDHARTKLTEKRDRRVRRDGLAVEELAAGEFNPDRWIDLDQTLAKFETVDPAAAGLAKLRVFGGLSVEEAGDTLGLPRATAYRLWTYARAWLTSRLAPGSE